jgi:hypothetical protein
MRGKRLSGDLVSLLYKKHDEGHSTQGNRVLNTHDQLNVSLGRPRCTSTVTDRAIVVALKR